ncbi:MAG: helix-turn-helix domain-containing protein, partial [Rhodobacteraceae bacterium]|nr:helix-turn-helix domain-containing protein [Paracoccaceae bacterium]
MRLGDLLRGERATLGKSLMDVQRELRINANYISAIENCDYGAFETPSFVSGFVRSYARYLKLDQEQVYRHPSAIVPNKKSWTDQFEAAAVGSIAVLCLLVAGLGYGAWSVFQEIQKVQVVPSENTPIVLSEFNGAAEGEETTDIVGISPDQRSDKLERMYRPPALDTPILVARDAPISTLDPNRFANFPEPKAEETLSTIA